jgi:hypothetical protein
MQNQTKIKTKPLPELEYLKQALRYNKKTGILTWKKRPREHFKTDSSWKCFASQFAGKQAGNINKRGILVLEMNGITYAAHRIAFKMANGRDPIGEVDHKNMKKTNNKISNLREASHSQNQHNTTLRKDNSSGFKGVSFNKEENKYRSRINVNGKEIFLGSFISPESAFEARKKASNDLHGDFARNAKRQK